jgi:hypothetical protein
LDEGPLLFTVVWMIVSLGFVALGVYGLKRPESLVDLFRRTGTPMFGKRVSVRMYTANNLRWALVPFVVMGLSFVIIGAVSIAIRLG